MMSWAIFREAATCHGIIYLSIVIASIIPKLFLLLTHYRAKQTVTLSGDEEN